MESTNTHSNSSQGTVSGSTYTSSVSGTTLSLKDLFHKIGGKQISCDSAEYFDTCNFNGVSTVSISFMSPNFFKLVFCTPSEYGHQKDTFSMDIYTRPNGNNLVVDCYGLFHNFQQKMNNKFDFKSDCFYNFCRWIGHCLTRAFKGHFTYFDKGETITFENGVIILYCKDAIVL